MCCTHAYTQVIELTSPDHHSFDQFSWVEACLYDVGPTEECVSLMLIYTIHFIIVWTLVSEWWVGQISLSDRYTLTYKNRSKTTMTYPDSILFIVFLSSSWAMSHIHKKTSSAPTCPINFLSTYITLLKTQNILKHVFCFVASPYLTLLILLHLIIHHCEPLFIHSRFNPPQFTQIHAHTNEHRQGGGSERTCTVRSLWP